MKASQRTEERAPRSEVLLIAVVLPKMFAPKMSGDTDEMPTTGMGATDI